MPRLGVQVLDHVLCPFLLPEVAQRQENVQCLLGMAALLMRKGDDAQTLQVASEILDKARSECRPDAGTNLFVEVEYLTTMHQALSGDEAIARIKLQRLRSDNPDVPRYEKALIAIGR